MANACVGIDLGTSNSSIYVATENSPGRFVEITQLAGAGSLVEKKSLPSACYLPHEGEFTAESLKLPWNHELSSDVSAVSAVPVDVAVNENADKDSEPSVVVGQFARERGAQLPDRLVTSAKSWLCHHHVDRREKILPWQSDVEHKISPFEASKKYLEHIVQAFKLDSQRHQNEMQLDQQNVVLTVPASFDDVARALTHEAAQAAGLAGVTLLEEPLAAFYAWIADCEDWRDQIGDGDLVLICDVGGGTADFSLVAITDDGGKLSLDRISVGDHILLGGDNMDLALAYMLRGQLEATHKKIDEWQFLSLINSVRIAKERLFNDTEIDEVPISIASRGSSLFAKIITAKLTREVLLQIALEGFLPLTDSSELPKQQQAMGLKEVGLEYAADPALSRHLAQFLHKSLKNVKSDPKLSQQLAHNFDLESLKFLKPTAILFNGGVFNARALQERTLELLNRWTDTQLKVLKGNHLDLAVARGAAYYSQLLQDGEGLRIKAGTARSYYLGLETTMLAVPGYTPPVKGLCIVPQGMEEGSQLDLQEREFGLVTGEPVEFRFFGSSARAGDAMGDVITEVNSELEELSTIQVKLSSLENQSDFQAEADSESDKSEIVPVSIRSVITELGTLELYMKHTSSEQKWKLEFNVRGQ
jgi:molecular chaperone DnaK (HSP70)